MSTERPVGIDNPNKRYERDFREAANALNLEGFTVTRFELSEDLQTAIMDIESTHSGEPILAKFVKLANSAFEDLNFGFVVILTLTDFTNPAESVEVIYTIKRYIALDGKSSDEVSITMANKFRPGVLSPANQEDLSETMLHQAV
jgi:hypothetical protein